MRNENTSNDDLSSFDARLRIALISYAIVEAVVIAALIYLWLK